MATDDELSPEDIKEIVREYCLNYFEGMHARDGAIISIETLYNVIGGASRTEIREAIELFSQNDVLHVAREAGIRVLIYRPFSPYMTRFRVCHLEANPDGTVSTTNVKLLLQEYVVLDEEQRQHVLKELVNDRERAIRMGTMRRAAVDQLLHDSLITFKVAPEPESS